MHCLVELPRTDNHGAALASIRRYLARGTMLQIHCPRGLARTVIAPSLPRLIQQHPELSVCIRTYDRLSCRAMEAGSLVVTLDEMPGSDVIVHPLSYVRFVTCASFEFVGVHGMPSHPKDLNPRHCIQVCSTPSHAAVVWRFQRGADRIETSSASELSFTDDASAAVAAVHGGGFVHLPQYEVEQAIACGLLTEVLADWSVARVLVALTSCRPTTHLTHAQTFLHFLRTVFPR